MVASISAMTGGQGHYYLGLAAEDYYLSGGEPLGQWYGTGASQLGLYGIVERHPFHNVSHGRSVDDSTKLVQIQKQHGRKEHAVGWDITASAPKSLSVVWSQANPEIRSVIQECHRTAVRAMVQYLEDTAAWTRRGKGGHKREKASLVVACFEHGTSRANDPQLHTHCLVLNVCVRADGSTGTLESRSLYKAKMAAGSIYRAELAYQLERRLGLVCEREKSWFGLRGVPKPLTDEFSKRRQVIEEKLAAEESVDPKRAAELAISTREAKETRPRAELFDEWQKVGRKFGFTGKDVEQLIGMQNPRPELAERTAAAIKAAIEKVTHQQSHFSERDFVRYVAEEAQGLGFGADTVISAARQHLATSPEIIHLGGSPVEPRYTTREVFELEKKMLADVEATKGSRLHLVSEKTVQYVLERFASLTKEQADAVRHVTAKEGSIAAVSGMAGTGKTKLLEATRVAWERDGYTVLGCALAGKAACGLEEGSGIKSVTIAKMLQELNRGVTETAAHHLKQLARAAAGMTTWKPDAVKLTQKTIVVCDEASLVDTKQMAEIVAKCRQAGAKLVLVGDAAQLQAIERGGSFKAISDRVGQASLTNIIRQKEAWAREAVKSFASGNADMALKAYAERGFVRVAESRKEAVQNVIESWSRAGVRKPQENLILASTNEECRKLNSLAQEAWLKSKRLPGFRVRVGADYLYLGTPHLKNKHGERLFEGDRILFERNSRAYGVRNGQLGTIKRIDQVHRTFTVMLDGQRKPITLSYRYYKDFSLGYCVSVHRAQGITVDNSYLLVGGSMEHREMAYVQASRARKSTRFFTDKWEAGEELADLKRQMNQSREKTLAHSILAEARSLAHQPPEIGGRPQCESISQNIGR